MKFNFKEKLKTLYERIKKIKHIQIYMAIGLALIVCCTYFISIGTTKSKENETQIKIDNISANFNSSGEYIDYLENKLESVITRVKGVGETDVVITLEKGFEYIYATEEETKTTSNGTSITSSSIVMVDGQPVIKEEIYPIVKGIVVVAYGAEDISVKMSIISIIQTVIEIDNTKINIISGQ